LIFLLFLAVTLWFHYLFLFIFRPRFYHNSSLFRITYCFLGTWGDFLRCFTYFFLFQRDNYRSLCAFFMWFLRAHSRN
jgi:hypothetical protein